MENAHFHKIAEEYSVNCIRGLVTDKDFLNALKKIGAKITGLNNYGNDTGQVVFNLWIPSGKHTEIQRLIMEKHNFFVKSLGGKKLFTKQNKEREIK